MDLAVSAQVEVSESRKYEIGNNPFMKLRLFNLLAALSLVLCVTMLGFWVRSYWKFDEFYSQVSNEPAAGCCSLDGNLEFYLYPRLLYARLAYLGGAKWGLLWYVYERKSTQWIGECGMKSMHPPRYNLGSLGIFFSTNGDCIYARHWMLALFFAILPLLALVKTLKRTYQMIGGRCVRCGYDLRATPDRCPECGTVPNGTESRK
jgi:hypothetical protein